MRNFWQHIGFCLDFIMQMNPTRILDVGAGASRWGVLLRDLSPGSQVPVDALEMPHRLLPKGERAAYSDIYTGDPVEIVSQLTSSYTVAVIENALEALPKQKALQLLEKCLDRSDYVIIVANLFPDGHPAQAVEQPSSPFQSTWTSSDFAGSNLVHQRIVTHHEGRSFGVFLISRRDPQGMAARYHPALEILQADLMEKMRLQECARWLYEYQHQMQAYERQLRETADELYAVTHTRAWQTWTRLRSGPIGRLLGGRPPIQPSPEAPPAEPAPKVPQVVTPVPVEAPSLASTVRALTEPLTSLPKDMVLALHHPLWFGVGNAARQFFDYILPLPEVSAGEADEVASVILETGARTIVINGLPEGHLELAAAIKKQSPQVRVLNIWQGTPAQLLPGPASHEFLSLLNAAQAGIIDRIGFGKEGMAETFSRTGISATFILNYLRFPPPYRYTPFEDGQTHIGILFASLDWRKNIYSQLFSVAHIPNAVAHLAPSDPSLETFAEMLRIPCEVVAETSMSMPPWEVMSRMDINLNLGLSECGPMMPIESLYMGIPGIISGGSHFFRDHPYLHERLCVDYHDNSVAIAQVIQRALDEREEIIKAFNTYIPEYNERARQSIEDFLRVD